MKSAVAMKKIVYAMMLVVCSGAHSAEFSGYLKGYEAQWAKDPRAANLAWFKEARFGMFIHFSPASRLTHSSKTGCL